MNWLKYSVLSMALLGLWAVPLRAEEVVAPPAPVSGEEVKDEAVKAVDETGKEVKPDDNAVKDVKEVVPEEVQE